jgi:gamma-glutamylcyclotransferase (GGCT)/AIG2-like uncharacterized protein YtfP
MELMEHRVFVYGTLRKGECNHHYLGKSEMLCVAETAPHYALFNLGPYPGLIEGNQRVTGEVYRIDDATLVELDILEEVPIEYRRELIETAVGSAWIYLYQGETQSEALIPSGDWCLR